MAERERVGFIGVGLMGHGMARNIVEKGYPLTVLGHRNRKPVKDLVKRGAAEAKSPKALAAASDVVFLCVTSSVEVEDLVRRPDGLAAGARKGTVIVDCSTSNPASTITLAAELAEKGVTFMDSPLGRTPKEAEEGRLNAFVGADARTLRRLTPLFETWAENIIHCGPVGSGHRIKLINNFVSMTYAALFAEAYATCHKAGVDPRIFDAVISAGGLNNGFYQNLRKWILFRDPKAHEFAIRNCAKDIRYYTQMCDGLGALTMVSDGALQTYKLAIANGWGDLNMPRMVDAMTGFNGIELPPPPKAKGKARKGKAGKGKAKPSRRKAA